MAKKSTSISTLSIHAGNQKDNGNNAIMIPITTASSFILNNLTDHPQFAYSRVSNPTRYAYETALAEIENGVYATATASGVAAAFLALELLPKNAHIVAMVGVYGGTFRLFENIKKESSGFTFTYIDLNDTTLLENSINDNTKMIWIETPTNPLLNIVDIEKVCKISKKYNLLTCVDNTFATAWNQQPLNLGADLVMLSTSKYINGHSDVIGGALITNNLDLAKKNRLQKNSYRGNCFPF